MLLARDKETCRKREKKEDETKERREEGQKDKRTGDEEEEEDKRGQKGLDRDLNPGPLAP